ncbi:MAG: hypothetical protein M3066_03545, partial [Actinomycetota bacterium]|nr:hypothetical protein [Actinomycetota bacterium]
MTLRRLILMVAMTATVLSPSLGGTARAQAADPSGDVAPVAGDTQPTPRDAGRAADAGRQA